MDTTELFEEDEPQCSICSLAAASNHVGDLEPLLVCRDCGVKGEFIVFLDYRHMPSLLMLEALKFHEKFYCPSLLLCTS